MLGMKVVGEFHSIDLLFNLISTTVWRVTHRTYRALKLKHKYIQGRLEHFPGTVDSLNMMRSQKNCLKQYNIILLPKRNLQYNIKSINTIKYYGCVLLIQSVSTEQEPILHKVH